MTKTTTIGVLALQGAFIEHVNILKKILPKYQSSMEGQVIEVRTLEQLESCDALVIPGGESTAISLVAERSGLLEPLRKFVKVDKKPVWGTCAGLILLSDRATQTRKDGQELIGGLDITVIRNHFGRQIDSFMDDVQLDFLNDKFKCVFIRAPVVETVGKSVQVLAKVRDQIVAVQQDNILGTSFHPELTSDSRVHEYFVEKFVIPSQ